MSAHFLAHAIAVNQTGGASVPVPVFRAVFRAVSRVVPSCPRSVPVSRARGGWSRLFSCATTAPGRVHAVPPARADGAGRGGGGEGRGAVRAVRRAVAAEGERTGE